MDVNEDQIKKLVSHFYSACSFCDELNIYEWEDADDKLSKMKDWVDQNFKP